MNNFKYLLIVIATMTFLCSCGQKKGDKENEMIDDSEPKMEAVQEEQTPERKTTDWRSRQEELAGMDPLTKDQIGAWYPKSLLGLPATNEQTTATEEMAMFTITYYANKQRINLNIMDGAGTRGAQITAPAHMIVLKKINEESEYGYHKTVSKNGIIARESYIQNNNTHNLDFFYKNRLFVKLKVMNLSAEKAWEAVGELDLDALIK